MADDADPRPGEPEDAALATAARHALHDEELVAAFATDGDAAEEAERAKALIERCTTCRDLHADLVAIGSGLRAFEAAAAVAATERAPRDFRLSIDTANRLKPGSVVLRLRDRIRDALASVGRPVGLSMASLGVVGLLLGTLTLGSLPGAAMAPADNGGVGAAGPSAAAGGAETQATGELTGTSGTPRETLRRSSFDAESTAAPAATTTPATDAAGGASSPNVSASAGPTLPTIVLVGSAVLLVGGIALLLLGSRRREPIPGR